MRLKNRIVQKFATRVLLLVVALIVILLITYFGMRNSIHTVIPNQVYRSAQLPPQTLKHFIRSKGIKSIVNLRGDNSQSKWYLQEVKIAAQNHVKHYDVRLHSTGLPSTQLLRKLVHTLQTAPKPMLLHCKSGADRTGAASAIVLILDKNAPLATAEKQFSWVYFVLKDNSIGKAIFPHYKHWLKAHELQSNRKNFLKWVNSSKPL